jgi:hypothetical protein
MSALSEVFLHGEVAQPVKHGRAARNQTVADTNRELFSETVAR